MSIHYISLLNQWEAEKKDLMLIIEKALSTGHYVNTTAEINEKFEIIDITDLGGGDYDLNTDITISAELNNIFSTNSRITFISFKPKRSTVTGDSKIRSGVLDAEITTSSKDVPSINVISIV